VTGQDQRWRSLAELPYAFGPPPSVGRMREVPEDFKVDEVLGFAPDGEGEHWLLRIRKRGVNTDWVARRLASVAGVAPREVSYAGLKDRRAVTSQWFSIRAPGRTTPNWDALEAEGLELLDAARHRRKLRRGVLKANRFQIRLRGVQGDRAALDARLRVIRERGFPNYFGGQRFGHGYRNLSEAARLFSGRIKGLKRHQRGLYLSAARSMLFNELLARRIEAGRWDMPLTGDLVMLEGSHSRFEVDTADASILARASELDLHPTGPLFGRGDPEVGGQPAQWEAEVAQCFAGWVEGLGRFGLRRDRRALRAVARGLKWHLADGVLTLDFSLAPGCYATQLLREAVSVSEP